MSLLDRGAANKRGTALLLTALVGSGICLATVLAALAASRASRQRKKGARGHAHHGKQAHAALQLLPGEAAARYQAER